MYLNHTEFLKKRIEFIELILTNTDMTESHEEFIRFCLDEMKDAIFFIECTGEINE